MKILKFFRDQIVYLSIDIIIFLIAFLFIFKGYNPNNSNQKNAVYLAIGTSLIAAGIVAILEFWKDLSKNKMLEKINNVILSGGVNCLFQKRDLDKYDQLMKNLSNRLDITGYSLNAFYESYGELLIQKSRELPSLTVRIILINPESIFSKHRAELEEKSDKSIKESVNRLKNKFESINNIKLKLLDSPLSTMIFRIDDIMFIGPHLYKKYSKSTITMELDKNGWMFEEYENEFERMWGDANS